MKTLQELSAISGLLRTCGSKVPVYISRIDDEESKLLTPRYFRFRHHRPLYLYSFHATVPCDLESFEIIFCNSPPQPISLETKQDCFVFDAVQDLDETVKLLILAANLAIPGSLTADKIASFVDGEPYRCQEGFRHGRALEFFGPDTHDWPEIRFLDLSEALQWLCSVPGYSEGFGITPLTRALACFSHLFREGESWDSPLDILWPLIGLEALYCSNGSRRELVEKVQLFLGNDPIAKKAVQRAYEIRSSFLHGGMNIPRSFAAPDDGAQIKWYDDDTSKLEGLATRMLIGSFQKMISKRLFDIRFEQRLIEE